MGFSDVATGYVEKGFSIMPLKQRDKRPMLPWEKFQTEKASKEQVGEWMVAYPQCNIAIITGSVSGVMVLDVDGEEGRKALKGKPMPATLVSKTGRGHHYFFKLPDNKRVGNFVGLLPKVDIRGEGGYVVAPGSIHPSGSTYEWALEEEVADCPQWLLDLIETGSSGTVPDAKAGKSTSKADSKIATIKKGISAGGRNDALSRLAGHYIGKGIDYDDTFDLLKVWNAKNKPPLTEKEIKLTLDSIFKKEKAGQPQQTIVQAPPITLDECKRIIAKWLYHKDQSIIDVILATVASTHHPGDPLWVIVVGAPSSGKTEIMRGFDKHKDTYFIDRVSPATFVTGFTKAKGILERMGPEPKTFVIQDFSTILSKPPYDRMEILDTLRQMYNGTYHNEWGNGKRFSWKGKVGVIAGCTPDIEASSHSMAELGERFLYYRVESDDDDTRRKMMDKARAMEGLESVARGEISKALHGVIENIQGKSFDDITMDKQYGDWLADLVDLTTSLRTPVKRNHYRREVIEYTPHKEGPGRMYKACQVLLKSLAMVRGRTKVNEEDYAIAVKICADSVQSVRREALKGLMKFYGRGGVRAKDVAQATGYQATESVGYHLSDLSALGVVDRWIDKHKVGHSNAPFLFEVKQEAYQKLEDSGLKDIL